jgi:exodeoxyribonuclease VII small subunit
MKIDHLSYSEAIERLDAILEDIDQSKVPIDLLAERVTEAAALLKRCKSVLTETEAKVRDVLEDLEKDFGEGSEAAH